MDNLPGLLPLGRLRAGALQEGKTSRRFPYKFWDLGQELAPSATTSTRLVAANQTEYRGVPVGQNYKIAVISNSWRHGQPDHAAHDAAASCTLSQGARTLCQEHTLALPKTA